MRKLSRCCKSLFKENSGLATIEFALASTILVYGLMNGLEAARYSFQKMEVRNAVHAAAHAAWNACDTQHLPAKTNCGTALNTAIANGLASTSLGTAVTATATSPTEGYYCLATSGSSNTLTLATSQSTPTCSNVGGVAYTPADYLFVSATYSYTPLFGTKLTIGHLFPTTITATSQIRLK